MRELTPRQVVEELDKYIVGQKDAKRAIAVAIRNRWRRQQVEGDMRDEIGPKNMMMIGPTGVGKTELARRLASLTGAPFIKVDATKYTEVGYYGRDVESMARDLVENSIGIIRAEERERIAEKAKEAAEKRILSALVAKFSKEGRDLSEFGVQAATVVVEPQDVPKNDDKATPGLDEKTLGPDSVYFTGAMKNIFDSVREFYEKYPFDPNNPQQSVSNAMQAIANGELDETLKEKKDKEEPKPEPLPQEAPKDERSAEEKKKKIKNELRDKVAALLKDGKLEDELIPVSVRESRRPSIVMGSVGVDSIPDEIQSMFENLGNRRKSPREMTVSDARRAFIDEESDNLLDKDKINERAVKLAEELGIIFIDEIDKIVGTEGSRNADVSRQGVQRDLLPLVEGTIVQTKYGFFSTEHVLFIAAGAFHRAKPSDLTPELQGRFPIRVELSELKKEDFVRILTEPKNALTKQYAALMKTENVELTFKDDAIEAIAEYAAETNLTTQNIGARRLYTIMELLLEDLNFEAAEMESGRVEIDAEYVRSKIDKVVHDEDLSKFVL
ncbi:MAG: HslU--HslV peptidase ATPase subunit [Thermoguttaceae bacterium]|nr:HslU--HslV peptidase ATPase subunit [Thermoguttaceae bacterium]MBR4753395.1 HslU--HslV peptidase ATPase subunit [Thermoguttaceae bacterium]MBR5757340.1 HslU--HslV peptidase ATPase subunit [Thermoguttaceae bacterium]